jgi:hypothetical protein
MIEARDFTGDGHIDLVCRTGSLEALGAVGNGDRTFGHPERYIPTTFWLESLAFGDFDGDGHVDFIGAGGNDSPPTKSLSTVTVFLNRAGHLVGVPARPEPGSGRVELAISSLAPNPSHGAFALGLQSASSGIARVAVLSPAGRIMFERTGVALTPGANRIALDAGRTLKPGVYWVHASLNGHSAVRKAVVLP